MTAPSVQPVGQGRPGGWLGADLGPPTTLVLLRHGETVLTSQRRFSGIRTDLELTAYGREQARRAADRLCSADPGLGPVDGVVSSPLRRARATAAIVAGALGRPVDIDVRLAECDFGDWDGLAWAEIQRDWPDQLAAWLGSSSVAPPGGESFDAVAHRVRQMGEALMDVWFGRTVLVVSHVTPIKVLVSEALAAPVASVYRMELAAASLSVVQWYGDGRATLRLFNDTAHLR